MTNGRANHARVREDTRALAVEFEPPSTERAIERVHFPHGLIDVGNFDSARQFARALPREQVVLMQNDNHFHTGNREIDVISG